MANPIPDRCRFKPNQSVSDVNLREWHIARAVATRFQSRNLLAKQIDAIA